MRWSADLRSQNTALCRFFFFKFFMKSCCHAHDWPIKRQFCQNNTILWAKVSRMPFFSDFSRNNHRSYAHILWKNVHSLKTHCPEVYILSKKRPFSQKHCAPMSFFQNFHEKPLLSRSYLVKNRQFSQKYIIIWPNKSIGCPFFRFFTKK